MNKMKQKAGGGERTKKYIQSKSYITLFSVPKKLKFDTMMKGAVFNISISLSVFRFLCRQWTYERTDASKNNASQQLSNNQFQSKQPLE